MDREQAFHQFAVERAPALYRSARLLCGDVHLAEDLVQETLAKVYNAWRRRGIDNPVGYAHTTLVRTFISSRRRRSSGEIPAAHLPDTAGRSSDHDLRLDLFEALSALDMVDRAVLVLRFLEDQSVQQTSGLLRISEGAVRSRTQRALKRLRTQLASQPTPIGGHS